MSKSRRSQTSKVNERSLPQPAGAPRLDVTDLLERLATLELALEDEGWLRLSGSSEEGDFSRDGIRRICDLARIYWVKNPLIRRAVNVKADYVFGQGVTIRAKDPGVNDALQAFLDDSKNRAVITTAQALLRKEQDLQVFGNLFLVFFVDRLSGAVRVRSVPVGEIAEIITDPEDSEAPWYYKRAWTTRDARGMPKAATALYPDWHYRPKAKPDEYAGTHIEWGAPIFHVSVNRLSDMRFGVSEVYAALDWAKAYTVFLENWSTIVKAYARFAWNLTVEGGKRGVAAAKTKLGTTLGAVSGETNPPPVAGSTFIGTPGTKLEPIRTGGATTSAEDGRRLLLMVAAATGLPESFFGDVSVGTLATAKSLDRPTELAMRSRQSLWADALTSIGNYVVEQAVRATDNDLQGTVEEEADGTPHITLAPSGEIDPSTGEPIPRDPTIIVTFPPLLEHDVEASVRAIVLAATLGGSGTMAGAVDPQTVSRMLLQALGVEDIDAVMDVIYPPEGEQETAEPAESQMVEAVKELRGAIAQFVERSLARAA